MERQHNKIVEKRHGSLVSLIMPLNLQIQCIIYVRRRNQITLQEIVANSFVVFLFELLLVIFELRLM